MKKLISLLLCVSLLTFGAVPVLADGPQFKSTLEFASILDGAELPYTYKGLSSDGEAECIVLKYDSTVLGNKQVQIWFYQDGNSCMLAIDNVVEYDPSRLVEVLASCDRMNSAYRFARFYTDDTDNTVTAQFDLVLDPSLNCSMIVVDGFVTIIDVAEAAYSNEFTQYAATTSGGSLAGSLFSQIMQ